MLFGHNSNVTIGTDIVHVQTEDRGANHASIDTTVHWKGRVLHRRTSNYLDLLPWDAEREAAVKARLDEQHRVVIDEIRSGALKLTFPAAPTQTAVAAKSLPLVTPALKLELTNAKTWLSGKEATLHLAVRDVTGNPAAGAEAKARVEGAQNPAEFATQTGSDGAATLRFEMPKLTGVDAALVIEATHGAAKGQLRFQLRAKSRA
jgi:uncharacterized protein YfaS (alpha-2-macroglobulin family)